VKDCLTTERLVLRRWRDSDRRAFRNLNGDTRVMEFMPKLLTWDESDRLMKRFEAHFEEHGFGIYAVEMRESQSFVGFLGLAVPDFDAAFTPCVEIGWRLAHEHWGQGLATEGARDVLREGFERQGLARVVSFTVPMNVRSVGVMERLGMVRDPDGDFEHPKLPEGHALRRHVLYRLDCARWRQGCEAAQRCA
jgi:ribosomal-protein-alanine N-acetyltransferase